MFNSEFMYLLIVFLDMNSLDFLILIPTYSFFVFAKMGGWSLRL
jgi:hypothetical protein